MTTNKDNSSSFGTIIFTTNIPGDKEHTLDPTVISYIDNPDLKITKTANKIYYYSDKIINTSFFTNLERTNILNILFNKNRFEKIAYTYFNDSDDEDKGNNITKNIMTYIENIFTTFPKSNNIKTYTETNIPGSLKFSIPFTSIPYTYLKVNGIDHTVSRVVYYASKDNDETTIEILNDYNEFDKWMRGKTEKTNGNIFLEPLVKDFEKLFGTKTKTNLSNTFGKKDGDEVPDFDTIGTAYKDHIRKIEQYINQSKEIPSSMWEANKSNDYFFIQSDNKPINNKTQFVLFGDTSAIRNSIDSLIKEPNIDDNKKKEIESLIQNFVSNFKNKGILTSQGRITAAASKNLNIFKQEVKDLLKKIERIIGSIATNKLWLDEVTETEIDSKDKTPNKAEKEKSTIKAEKEKSTIKAEKENSTEGELNEKKKQYLDKIASLNSHKDEYEKYYEVEHGSRLVAQVMSNLSDHATKGMVETARIDEEVSNFKQAIMTIFKSYKELSQIRENNKEYNFDVISKECRNLYTQLKGIKRPDVLNPSIIPVMEFKALEDLLESFIIHSDIYTSFKAKLYDTDLLDSKYKKYNEYKKYIDFIRKIKKIYEYNNEFELSKMEDMIKDGILIKVREDSGFENESIRLHIDLIKGKVNADNVNQITCAYNDDDLVQRWDKLGVIPDTTVGLEYKHYFKLDDIKVNNPKQTKNAKQTKKRTKQTRKRGRKKGLRTRKQ